MSTNDPRLGAANQVRAVVDRGRSLSQPGHGQSPLGQALSYGVLRHLGVVQALLEERLKRPIKSRDQDLHYLLLVAIYELGWLSTPPHAVINEAVSAARRLGKPWASGLVNAVLRGYQRDGCPRAPATGSAQLLSNHPEWLLQSIQTEWPAHADEIIAQNNRQAPLALRVNLARGDRDRYLARLAAEGIEARAAGWTDGCVLLSEPMPVRDLPGFGEGQVSVQDAAAQLAGPLLAPAPGDRVLDACAAPGGKTGQLLELNPGIDLTAADVDPDRCRLIRDNLDRLGLDCRVLASDALALEGPSYDGILLDAPCSATGVIRRHPDIKWLRRAEDIARLARLQGRLLDHLWTVLKPGGRLLYATCSLLPAENGRTIEAFLARCPEASVQQPPLDFGREAGPGRQILPGDHDADGFYYALLEKSAR